MRSESEPLWHTALTTVHRPSASMAYSAQSTACLAKTQGRLAQSIPVNEARRTLADGARHAPVVVAAFCFAYHHKGIQEYMHTVLRMTDADMTGMSTSLSGAFPVWMMECAEEACTAGC